MADGHGSAESTAGFSVERIARNDAIFREANETIREVAEHEDVDEAGARLPFVCECADPACRELVRMTLDEYREMRDDPRLFVNVPGHQASAHGWADVVARTDGHVIVQKLGRAGEVVEALEDEQILPQPKERL